MSKCRCDYCVEGIEKRYALNDINDYDEEPRYRKVSKSKKYCKKSKTKEKCVPTERRYKWAYTRVDEYGRSYEDGYYTKACYRCGKEFGLHRFSTKKAYAPYRSLWSD